MSEVELTCREVVELVNDYLCEALSERDRARFIEHLATCSVCTTYVDQMRSTIELTGRLREDQLDEAIKRELLETFRRWRA